MLLKSISIFYLGQFDGFIEFVQGALEVRQLLEKENLHKREEEMQESGQP